MDNGVFDANWKAALDTLGHNPDHEVVELGWEQHVLIDHKKAIVYRYPRRRAAALKLLDEVGVLRELGKYQWPVHIPQIIEQTPEFTSYTYIPGEVLTEAKAQLLDDEQIMGLGRSLGEFFVVMHCVAAEVVTTKKAQQSQSLLAYYQSRIEAGIKSPWFEAAQRDLGDLLAVESSQEVVVHGDLHGPNMVIDPATKQLVGVIDFSEVELGDPRLDLRKPFMTDARLLQPMLDVYNGATGRNLEKEHIRLWAYVNEWANLCYLDENRDSETFKRAERHLRTWNKI